MFVIKLITNYLESLDHIKPKSNLSLIDTDCKRVKFILLERFFLPQARLLAFQLLWPSNSLFQNDVSKNGAQTLPFITYTTYLKIELRNLFVILKASFIKLWEKVELSSIKLQTWHWFPLQFFIRLSFLTWHCQYKAN